MGLLAVEGKILLKLFVISILDDEYFKKLFFTLLWFDVYESLLQDRDVALEWIVLIREGLILTAIELWTIKDSILTLLKLKLITFTLINQNIYDDRQ